MNEANCPGDDSQSSAHCMKPRGEGSVQSGVTSHLPTSGMGWPGLPIMWTFTRVTWAPAPQLSNPVLQAQLPPDLPSQRSYASLQILLFLSLSGQTNDGTMQKISALAV